MSKSASTSTRPGRKPKPKTALQAQSQDVDRDLGRRRRRISAKDRRFVELFAAAGYKDPNKAAIDAGFLEPLHGEKLIGRLSELIAATRMRSMLDSHMELDEALQILARRARDEGHPRHDVYLRLVFQVEGALSDKPIDRDGKRGVAREVQEMIAAIKNEMKGKPGARARVRAMLKTDVDANGVESGAADVAFEISQDSPDESPSERLDPALPALPPHR